MFSSTRREDSMFLTGGSAVCRPEGLSTDATKIQTWRVFCFPLGAVLTKGWTDGCEFVSKQIKIFDG
jgi:hypothetical protein